MNIQAADLQKAVNDLWNLADLDSKFTAQGWSAADITKYPVLNDQEATPGQSMPYCVFQQHGGSISDRMSGGVTSLRHIVDTPIEFRIHAEDISGDSRSAKEIAAALAKEVMAIFGGHPTIHPQLPDLENGSCLIVQHLNDYGLKDGDYAYQWIISYNMKLDVPVAV